MEHADSSSERMLAGESMPKAAEPASEERALAPPLPRPRPLAGDRETRAGTDPPNARMLAVVNPDIRRNIDVGTPWGC